MHVASGVYDWHPRQLKVWMVAGTCRNIAVPAPGCCICSASDAALRICMLGRTLVHKPIALVKALFHTQHLRHPPAYVTAVEARSWVSQVWHRQTASTVHVPRCIAERGHCCTSPHWRLTAVRA
jgi:hypothetical protein